MLKGLSETFTVGINRTFPPVISLTIAGVSTAKHRRAFATSASVIRDRMGRKSGEYVSLFLLMINKTLNSISAFTFCARADAVIPARAMRSGMLFIEPLVTQ